MRSIWVTIIAILLGLLLLSSIASATDYNSRFVRNYPPDITGCGTTRKGSSTNHRPPELRSTGGTSSRPGS